MKVLNYILLITSLFLFSCDSSDDDFYNMIYISSPDLIEIERHPYYDLNRTLRFHIEVPNLISEEGHTTPIDIYRMTNSNVLLIGYHIEKWQNNQWVIFQNFDREFTDAITLQPDNYYRLTKEIVLSETGNYRLIFGRGFKPNTIGIVSRDTNPRTAITISTTAINYGDGYVFSVR